MFALLIFRFSVEAQIDFRRLFLFRHTRPLVCDLRIRMKANQKSTCPFNHQSNKMHTPRGGYCEWLRQSVVG